MKKTLIFAAAVMAVFTTASAGGFLTNTNASASFGRYFALEGYNSIEGAYYNPSGIGFLNKGWHLAFNNQSAFQTRTALSTFNSYKYGAKNNGLSARESEVLALVLAGKDNRTIATELFLSEGTIKSHVHNIMKKTGTSSRDELKKSFWAA